MGESQIILFPGSEVVFLGNKASGSGGAIFVYEHVEAHFVFANNPSCFLTYNNPFLPPSKWEVCSSLALSRLRNRRLSFFFCVFQAGGVKREAFFIFLGSVHSLIVPC